MRLRTTFRFAGFLALLVIGAGLFGCYSLSDLKTAPDPVAVDVRPDELLRATDFHFTFGDGSGWGGYNILKIQADNTCRYTFLSQYTGDGKQQWRRAEFTIDRQTVDDLRHVLNDVRFFGLKREYHDLGINDGTQRFVNVEASRKKKGVYCNNYFPPEIEKIRGFVERRIIEPRRQQIDKAPIVEVGPKDMEGGALVLIPNDEGSLM